VLAAVAPTRRRRALGRGIEGGVTAGIHVGRARRDQQPTITLIALLFRVVLSAVAPPGQVHRADRVRQADHHGPYQPAGHNADDRVQTRDRGLDDRARPITTTSAVAATTALSQVRGGVPSELVRSAMRSGISSPFVTDPPPMIMGPLFVARSATPAASTTPSGLVVPDLSRTAARFGLVPVRDGWLDNGVGAYLTASEYLGPFELAHGRDFDPSAWADVLLRLHPGELYVQLLAALNRAARFRDPVFEYQERFLRRLGPGLRIVVASVLAGGVDGRPRWFLARQPALRAMRMVLAGPAPAEEPDERIAALLAGIDPETAAMMLVHLAADALRGQQPEGEARFGGTSESLAIELVCNQIFNEPHDVGGMVSRTWALWNRHAAGLKRAKLDKPPLDLLQDAIELELAHLLALGFACWAMTTHDRVNGPVRINPFTLVKLPRETVERFLALFATTPEELASDLAACTLPWQMLPLQTRPLLRIGDEVVVLDESFLLEAVTTGLYWRVSDHVRKGDPEAWKPWSVAYAEMVEALDFDACRYTRRAGSNLDYDLAVISQPQPYDRGQVPGPEDLIPCRAAQMLHAPLGKSARIDGTRTR
jgi:hypothetical protein